MNARIFSIAGVAALMLGAGVAQANPFEGDQSIAPHTVATSAVSRTEVRAQFIDAQKNGTLLFRGDQLQANAFEKGSSLSRAEVVKAAHDARVAGTLPEGESFGE
ncbi:hypothetical protein M2375_002721 [Comamonas sp. BIGb0152]|uniref:hypothetical protein n=1 Tax=Comamonas sp. BIGb0152 TaxID=2940601 RepID=UPI0021682B23|nr:hypothetical protein [Comamonas sp. BIGb0152]MCS4294488.1 hypothetical protein [Comamonas sp. BIGb0152]